MGLLDGFSISASGMTAERLRMDVIAENLANANTTRGADGGPYRRKEVVLEQAGSQSFAAQLGIAGSSGGSQAPGGVRVEQVVDDPSPMRRVYDPGHPDADANGYVTMPNVQPVTEMVDLISASRGYEANVQALNATKQMLSRAIDILR